MPLILLIENRDCVREALRGVLEEAGHRVALASGAGEGLRLFRLRPADVVLCDLCLEDRSGLGVIRELRREWPGVRLVAMSGGGPWWEPDVLVAAQQLGADAALLKPFTVDGLLEAVNAPARHTA